MAHFNRVILAGNLTRDPEIRYLPSGQPVANFALAVNERYKQNGERKERVSFFDCAAFGRIGEVVAEHVGKGSGVLLEGRLRQRRWEDDGGGKRSKVEVLVDAVRFLGGRREDDATAEGPSGAAGDPSDDEFPF